MKKSDIRGKWIIIQQDGTVRTKDYAPEQYNPPTIFNRAVGGRGNWETTPLGQSGIIAVVNEEGLILRPPLKMNHRLPWLCGDVLLCTTAMIESSEGVDEPELVPFANEDVVRRIVATLEGIPLLTDAEAELRRPNPTWSIAFFIDPKKKQ